MAGLGAPLGGGWRLPPPYETIAAEQAAMGAATPGYGAGTPGVAERSGVPTRTGLAGMLEASPAPVQPQQDGLANYLAMMSPEKKKRPFWKDALGTVLDTIATATGGHGAYWSGIEKDNDEAKKVREKLAEMIYQRQAKQEDRAASLQDWKVQKQWERDNPAPASMVRDLDAWNSMTPQQQAEYARMMDVKSPVAVSQPDGSVARVPRTFGQTQPQMQDIDGRKVVNIGGQWYEVTE